MSNGTRGPTWIAAINALSGVAVVITALIVLSIMTGYLVSAVNSDDAKLAIATTALGVIGAVTGAFFGIKSATDSRRDAQDNAEQTQQKLNRVINATDKHDEAVKEALEG
jgi:hypothetical protein